MKNSTLLIIDDEPSYLSLLKGLLEDEGYQNIITEQFPDKVMGILKAKQVDLLLLDIYMPGINGVDLLEKIHMLYPRIPVIMVTAVDEVDIALKAVKLGAYEYILKPIITDRLFLTIQRALEQRILEKELDSRRVKFTKRQLNLTNFADIVTSSPKMHKIFELVEIYAPTNEMVLITGEPGTGKGLIAKKIHDLSHRKDRNFINLTLEADSEDNLEIELFGCEKGAVKDIIEQKTGLLEKANGGSFFLDGIENLPKDLQEKLLRAIQYNEITRIGSTNPIKLDLRIITSTTQDLARLVVKKEFRADLHYRITRALLNLPTLKERTEDIVLLTHHFIKAGNSKFNKKIIGIKKEVMDDIFHYNFPGNIQELEDKIYDAIEKTNDDEQISEIDVPTNSFDHKNKTNKEVKLLSINEAIKNHILTVMDYTGGNMQQASFILGVTERTLQRWLKNIK